MSLLICQSELYVWFYDASAVFKTVKVWLPVGLSINIAQTVGRKNTELVYTTRVGWYKPVELVGINQQIWLVQTSRVGWYKPTELVGMKPTKMVDINQQS